MTPHTVYENGQWWFYDDLGDRFGPFTRMKSAWDAMTDKVRWQDEVNELSTSGKVDEEYKLDLQRRY